MKRSFYFMPILAAFLFVGCEKEKPVHVIEVTPPSYETTEESNKYKVPESNADAVAYADLHDPVKDVGQFYLPDPGLKPEVYWTLVYSDYGGREDPTKSDISQGLQNYLLMSSVAGLVNKACAEGKTKVAVWIQTSGTGYSTEQASLGKEIGRQTAVELASNKYGSWNGYDVTVRQFFDGYVLTDLVNNPESGNVAVAASSVYNSIIVDVRDEEYFKNQGYELKYDCTKKTLADAFNEFKDQMNNDCLVVMPVKTGELREYAITNKLFAFNLNKQYSDASSGQNTELFDEVLDWLKPNSQVVGWEQGVGEDVFVNRVSCHGHLMLAADWSYNNSLTSRHYKERQPETLVKSINPRDIDYTKAYNYCSFFLTDGDNYQFIITDNFETNYYTLSTAATTKTAFEIGTQSLIQMAPTRFTYLAEKQPSAECTIMDTFGGGYYYVDTYSTTGTGAKNRAANLKVIAERTAAHMRQHGIKVLHVMAKDLSSSKTKEALQAFVDANDQLEGITAVQYNPYNAGKGEIYWFTNKAGYDIPCITTKYMIWSGQSTPSSVAADMTANEKGGRTHCTVCLHSWSEFDNKKSSDVAALCLESLPSNFKAVSMQELIWRVRMYEREEQTMKYLATIK